MNSVFKKDVSKLHSLETRFSKKTIACAITLSLGISAIPLSSFAATISGVRFVDSPLFANFPSNSSSEPVYNLDGYILFKRSGYASQFSTPVTGGNYSVNLPDGNYKMWQYVDTASTLLTSSQLNSIQWANEANALNLSISGSSILVSTATGSTSVPSGIIDFPFPNFSNSVSLPSTTGQGQACDINDSTDRKIVCGSNVVNGGGFNCDFHLGQSSSGYVSSFPGTPGGPPTALGTTFAGKRVFIFGTVPITDYGTYAPPIKVKSLCNRGVLNGERGDFLFNYTSDSSIYISQMGHINIEFTDSFVNFTDGSVIASNSNNANDHGGSINLISKANLGGIITPTGTWINQGTIKAGNAYDYPNVDSNFNQSTSVGGNINIDASTSYQYGALLAG